MPKELYYALNRAFDAVRTAEKDAHRLEQEAAEVRARSDQEVQALYDLIARHLTETPHG